MSGLCMGSISAYPKKSEKEMEQKIYSEDLTDIIICSNCGTQIKKAMKFCTECGAEL